MTKQHPPHPSFGTDDQGHPERVSWLESAELRLRELVELQDGPPPRELAVLLGGSIDELHTALRAVLRPAMVKARAGRCGLPWLGCPRHGDLLAYRGSGWGCTVEGCRFEIADTLARLRHCRRRTVAVLGEPHPGPNPYTLAVCEGHLFSEWHNGECGMPFTVRRVGTQGLAA
ncbi:hypothetical protein OG203_07625 [Nocardia sp. NBC_01499]|uniref:hypothetical protein n=1 Tax=Nocardia sp. NBC_01499 TaxID=2903597 RepID=UPI003869FF40